MNITQDPVHTLHNLETLEPLRLGGYVVYISGAISSDPDWKRKFSKWEKAVERAGAAIILSPSVFPGGWNYEDYMEHCFAMVRRAGVLIMLPDWRTSPGAIAEHAYANCLKKKIVDYGPRFSELDGFLEKIKKELIRAQNKFPSPNLNYIALGEEIGELGKALLDEPLCRVREEAAQAAVMAIRIALEGDSSVNAYREQKGLVV